MIVQRTTAMGSTRGRANVSLRAALCVSLSLSGAVAMAQDGNQPGQVAAGESFGDIVVTAQRRTENLQQVPIAVTAIAPAQLEQLNLRSIDAIQMVTPGLVFTKGFGFAQNFIRGIGSEFANAGLGSAVSTYVDGAYVERGYGTVFDLLDVGSIQVLKGPQGTLYGRNATGGAILVTTADPTDRFEGYVSGEYGRFDHVQGEAMVNIPLTDTLAVRFAGRYSNNDGYIHNLYDGRTLGGRRTHIIRGKIAWEPSPDFSAILAIEHSKMRLDTQAPRQILAPPLCVGCIAFPESVSDKFYQSDIDVDLNVHIRTNWANLRLKGTTGIFTIESITSYRDQKDHNPSDQDYTRASLFDFRQTSGGKTFTQDFIVSTDTGGWLDGMVGLTYLHDKGIYNLYAEGDIFADAIAATGMAPEGFNTFRTESVAAFGELTISPIERLKLTGGGRYNYDDRGIRAHSNAAGILAFGGGTAPATFRQGTSFSSFTPRFVIAYDADIVNLFASYNKGFKAGGYNTPAFDLQDEIRPEKIESFEIGAKFVSPDRRLRLNLSAFHYKHKDVQVTIIDLASGGGKILNAAAATGKGIEFDGQFQATPWLGIFAGGSYLHARYDDFPGASSYMPDPSGQPGLITIPGGENLAGFPLARAPDWSGFLGANVNAPIGDSMKGEFNVVAHYTSRMYFNAGAGGTLRLDQQGEYVLVNMSGAIGPADDRFQVGFYINNLTNKKYYEFMQTNNFGASRIPAPPRTFGGRVKYNF